MTPVLFVLLVASVLVSLAFLLAALSGVPARRNRPRRKGRWL